MVSTCSLEIKQSTSHKPRWAKPHLLPGALPVQCWARPVLCHLPNTKGRTFPAPASAPAAVVFVVTIDHCLLGKNRSRDEHCELEAVIRDC